MRILIINHNDRDKGTFFRCFSLGKNLSRLGYNIVLSCLNPKGNTLRTVTNSADGVTLVLLPGQYGTSSITELPFHFFRALINTKLALLGKFDAIYAFNVAAPTTGLPVIFLKILKIIGVFKGTLLVDCDDLWGKRGLTSIDGKGKIAQFVAGVMETKIPVLADKVTAVSHYLKNMLEEAGANPETIYLVPNGADTTVPYYTDTLFPRAELKLPADKHILCFVGRALWVFDYLIASLNLVIKKRPDLLAICIAPWNKVHFKMINKLGLSNHILCPGVQSHDNISLYLGAADLLLLPRIGNGSEMFNFPGRLGDYLAAGRPIVSTAIGDENERIMRMFNCGVLADPHSPASYSEKILQLLDDPKLRQKIGRNNRNTATDKLSWAIVSQNLSDCVLRK